MVQEPKANGAGRFESGVTILLTPLAAEQDAGN